MLILLLVIALLFTNFPLKSFTHAEGIKDIEDCKEVIYDYGSQREIPNSNNKLIIGLDCNSNCISDNCSVSNIRIYSFSIDKSITGKPVILPLTVLTFLEDSHICRSGSGFIDSWHSYGPIFFKNYCFIAGEKLHVIDISNPIDPEIVTEIPLIFPSFRITRIDSLLFILSFDDLDDLPIFEVIDVSNPLYPKVIGISRLNVLDGESYNSPILNELVRSIEENDNLKLLNYKNYLLLVPISTCNLNKPESYIVAFINTSYISSPKLEKISKIEDAGFIIDVEINNDRLFILSEKDDGIYLLTYKIKSSLDLELTSQVYIAGKDDLTFFSPDKSIKIDRYRNLILITASHNNHGTVFAFDPIKQKLCKKEKNENIFYYLHISYPYAINIKKGWNLKGTYFTIFPESLEINNETIIWTWEANNWYAWTKDPQTMEILKSFSINKLEKLKENQGFWLFSPSEGNLIMNTDNSTLNLEIPDVYSLQVNKGWNLITVPFFTNIKSFQKQQIISIWKWTGDNWLFWSPNPILNSMAKIYYGLNEFTSILPGEGIWINSKEDTSLNIKNQFKDTIFYLKNWNLKVPFEQLYGLIREISATGKYKTDIISVLVKKRKQINLPINHSPSDTISIYLYPKSGINDENFIKVTFDSIVTNLATKINLKIGDKQCFISTDNLNKGKNSYNCL